MAAVLVAAPLSARSVIQHLLPVLGMPLNTPTLATLQLLVIGVLLVLVLLELVIVTKSVALVPPLFLLMEAALHLVVALVLLISLAESVVLGFLFRKPTPLRLALLVILVPVVLVILPVLVLVTY